MIQEATTGCDAVLVDVAGPAVDEMVAAHPYYVAATIPAGLYRGTARAVATFGVVATLVTRADVADDVIGSLVQAIFADFEMLNGLDPVLAGLDPPAMAREGLAAPLHPAAAALLPRARLDRVAGAAARQPPRFQTLVRLGRRRGLTSRRGRWKG